MKHMVRCAESFLVSAVIDADRMLGKICSYEPYEGGAIPILLASEDDLRLAADRCATVAGNLYALLERLRAETKP